MSTLPKLDWDRCRIGCEPAPKNPTKIVWYVHVSYGRRFDGFPTEGAAKKFVEDGKRGVRKFQNKAS